MANRKRKNQILFYVTDEEKQMIQEKMKLLGTTNMGAYLRKMAIDGYIIKVDYSEQRKLAAEVNKIGGQYQSDLQEDKRNRQGICRGRFGAKISHGIQVTKIQAIGTPLADQFLKLSAPPDLQKDDFAVIQCEIFRIKNKPAFCESIRRGLLLRRGKCGGSIMVSGSGIV